MTADGAVDQLPNSLALELRDIVAGYGETEVLHGVTVAVPRGSFTALLGVNGAGKSTLLKVASGLLRPTAGSVWRDGADVSLQRSDARSAGGLCHIPEGRAIYRQLTVRENLTMQAHGIKDKEAIERAVSAFPVIGRRLRQVAGTMSGGEQQMLALAAAYVRSPNAILIDEPSLGLAPIITDSVFAFMAQLRGSDVGMLVVDQFALKLLRLADHAYVMNRGEIVYDGPPTGLDIDRLLDSYGETNSELDNPSPTSPRE
jgi:branched-chain amino acid transport system ATP-binding protein